MRPRRQHPQPRALRSTARPLQVNGRSIAQFLLDIGRRPVAGVVGAAGPIDHGRSVKLTNLQEWLAFDVDDARDNFGIQFHLFNDLVIAAAFVAGTEA